MSHNKLASAVCLRFIFALATWAGSAAVHAQWTVTSLHPTGQLSSEARGASAASQVGNVYINAERAGLWSGTADSWVNLDPAGSAESMALGASAANQVGWADVAGRRRASLWSGSAASWVDLNPAGALQSQALGAWGTSQVGWMYDGAIGRASLWTGTAASWVDLHPAGAASSEASAGWGQNQAGWAIVDNAFHASLWSGTAETWVDLHPLGAVQSEARGIANGYQVGVVDGHASLWNGTAGSWMDLNPADTISSELYAADGSRQVGAAQVDGWDHAGVWSGTAESWEDLHTLLSADFRYSYALSISSDASHQYIAGLGYNSFEGRFEALLWTRPVFAPACDFTADGLCDVSDLDLMQSLGPLAASVPVAGNEPFDLNGDGIIDLVDRDEWLALAAAENGFSSAFKPGDANVDGFVDGTDFIAWNDAKFTESLLWSHGDFTADGFIDGTDFIEWNENKFTSAAGVRAVPEPATAMLLLIAMLMLTMRNGLLI